MAVFEARARELGFTHIEQNTRISLEMLNRLLKTGVPVSSIDSPCPAVLSSQATRVSGLSMGYLDASKRVEAVGFAKKTIDLVANVGARAIVLHPCEVPIDPSWQDGLHKPHDGGYTQTKECRLVKDGLVHQRVSLAYSYVDAAKKNLQELSQYSEQKGIMLGLETRFHLDEIPNIDAMAEPLD